MKWKCEMSELEIDIPSSPTPTEIRGALPDLKIISVAITETLIAITLVDWRCLVFYPHE